MRKITFKAWIEYVNERQDVLEIEVDDDATFDDIETAKAEVTEEWASNYFQAGYSENNLTDEQID